MKPLEAVKEYQCPGCVGGPPLECYTEGFGLGCDKHCAGTAISGLGRIFLGMPKGFNRLGPCDDLKIDIFETFTNAMQRFGNYDLFNMPIWKYLDNHGNTFVRGISPRINNPFLHIILGNALDKIECLEITNADLAEMD